MSPEAEFIIPLYIAALRSGSIITSDSQKTSLLSLILLVSAISIPSIILSIIISGSSPLGLSDVTIQTSESSAAIFPITGRFVLSLSPPQPKTDIILP